MVPIRFYVEEAGLVVEAEEQAGRVRDRMQDLAVTFAVVVGEGQRFVGCLDLAREPLSAAEERCPVGEVVRGRTAWPQLEAEDDAAAARTLFQAEEAIRALPVVEQGRFLGVVLRSTLLRHSGAPADPPGRPEPSALLDTVLRFTPLGLFVVDPEGRLSLVNDAFCRFFEQAEADVLGRPLEEVVGPFFTEDFRQYLAESATTEARRLGRPVLERARMLRDGRRLLTAAVPLQDGSILVNFADTTAEKELEERLARAVQEAEEAFALMLPNSRVELKLRTSPEYRDEIDPDSGLVRVVEVIPDGTYRHVINALKIASDLKKVGALDRLGVDKDTIVQTMIYHDLGKQQPRLAVGDLIDPREVFEPSHLHAERSAAFAAGTYVRDENVLTLIRHHHHREEELPDTFPARLLPMLRIVRLIDGLSAAVTRNRARLTVGMEGNEIVVHEDNPRPQYCGTHRLEPFSGRYELVPDR